jgi:hypothetical protein
MSSIGSSVSSQSSEDVMESQPVTHHGAPPLERIRSEHEISSSRDTIYDNPNHARVMGSGGNDNRMHLATFNSSSRTIPASISHDPLATPNLSDTGSHEPTTWSEFLRESSTLTAGIGLASDADRMSTLAADRKRRLTGSAQDSGRRRTLNGGFHGRQLSGQSHPLDGTSSPQRSAWPRRSDSIDQSRTNYVDLTNSPPPASQQLPQPSSTRPPFISTRQYVLPRWQPDSEVSECPICKRQFSVFFRRHHCRKCGRVVCNDCSPHRITIPRQFIVHPPDASAETRLKSPGTRVPVETIDLTEDTGREERSNMTRITTTGSNPALGGGEKVRLCNPCVPDPQPSPHLDPNLSTPAFPTQARWQTGSATARPSDSPSALAIPQLADMYQATLVEQGSEPRRQRGRGMMVGQTVVMVIVLLIICG